MADKIKVLEALDSAEAASIRASMHLHEARSALHEGTADVPFDVDEAREEVGKAKAFLAQAEAVLQQLEPGDRDRKGR